MNKKLGTALFYSGFMTMFAFWQKNNSENFEAQYEECLMISIETSLEELRVSIDDQAKDKGLHCTPTPLGGELWECGEIIYKVNNFEHSGGNSANLALGPHLSPSKTLEEWGCRYDYSIPNDGMRCYRERIVTERFGLLAFYSFNLVQVEQ